MPIPIYKNIEETWYVNKSTFERILWCDGTILNKSQTTTFSLRLIFLSNQALKGSSCGQTMKWFDVIAEDVIVKESIPQQLCSVLDFWFKPMTFPLRNRWKVCLIYWILSLTRSLHSSELNCVRISDICWHLFQMFHPIRNNDCMGVDRL